MFDLENHLRSLQCMWQKSGAALPRRCEYMRNGLEDDFASNTRVISSATVGPVGCVEATLLMVFYGLVAQHRSQMNTSSIEHCAHEGSKDIAV
jgi:hypothetical protein